MNSMISRNLKLAATQMSIQRVKKATETWWMLSLRVDASQVNR